MEYIMSIVIMLVVMLIICVYLAKMVNLDVKATNKIDPWSLHPDDERAARAKRAQEFTHNNGSDPIVYGINHQNAVARKDNQKSIKSYHYADFEQVQYEAANGKASLLDYRNENER